MQDPTGQDDDRRAVQASLCPFDARFAGQVARWAVSVKELLWLAPSTPWPLTAEKVIAWTATRGRPYLLFSPGAEEPVAYGELNAVASSPGQLWLGHLLVDSARRGEGWGHRLTEALVAEAFGRLGARRVILVVFPDNAPAVRCYARIGFRLRSQEHHRSAADGQLHRLSRYELDPAEARTSLTPWPNHRMR